MQNKEKSISFWDKFKSWFGLEPNKNKSGVKTSRTLRQFNLLVLILIILSFIALIYVYSKIISSAAADERLNQMSKSANAISDFYHSVDSENYLLSDEQLSIYLNVVADASGTYLWIYDDSGRIYYVNDVPEAAEESIRISRDHYLYLPRDIINIDIPKGGINFTGGNLLGFFQDNGNWLTVIRELRNSEGYKTANLMLTYRLEPISDGAKYVVEGVLVVFLLALVLALVIIVIYSKRISAPINGLIKAATKVANGDFSARVDESLIPEANQFNDEANDIVLLVKMFNSMVDQIERGNSKQSDFIASISHDLRTPLTSIKGFISAILDGTIPEEKWQHYLEIVQNEVNRLSSLVSDMNSAIKLDNDIDPSEFEEFGIKQLIRENLEGIEILLDQKNIKVNTNIDDSDREIIVYGDEREISRVIYNLVTNAIKFVPEDNGIISLNIRAQGREILIVSVEDNGAGIAEDKLDHIFDRFYKVDHSRTGNTGSGLGLYICKRILQKHGQSIRAGKSESLGGAKFEFTLPILRTQVKD